MHTEKQGRREERIPLGNLEKFANKPYRAFTIYLNKDPGNYGVNCLYETNHFADPMGFEWGKCGVVFGSSCGSSTRLHLIARLLRRLHTILIWSYNTATDPAQGFIWRAFTIGLHWGDLLPNFG